MERRRKPKNGRNQLQRFIKACKTIQGTETKQAHNQLSFIRHTALL
jgi:hypothetical protein